MPHFMINIMWHYLHVLLLFTQQSDIDETLKASHSGFVEDSDRFLFVVLKLKDAIFGTTYGKIKCIFGTTFKFNFSLPEASLL